MFAILLDKFSVQFFRGSAICLGTKIGPRGFELVYFRGS